MTTKPTEEAKACLICDSMETLDRGDHIACARCGANLRWKEPKPAEPVSAEGIQPVTQLEAEKHTTKILRAELAASRAAHQTAEKRVEELEDLIVRLDNEPNEARCLPGCIRNCWTGQDEHAFGCPWQAMMYSLLDSGPDFDDSLVPVAKAEAEKAQEPRVASVKGLCSVCGLPPDGKRGCCKPAEPKQGAKESWINPEHERFYGPTQEGGEVMTAAQRAYLSMEREVSALREENERLKASRVTCSCGKDTASIKWAQCYNCRNKPEWEIEDLRASLAEKERDRCEECNSELAACGPQNVDGTPSMDCLVCQLRATLAEKDREIAELKGMDRHQYAHCVSRQKYRRDLAAEKDRADAAEKRVKELEHDSHTITRKETLVDGDEVRRKVNHFTRVFEDHAPGEPIQPASEPTQEEAEAMIAEMIEQHDALVSWAGKSDPPVIAKARAILARRNKEKE